MIPNALMVDSSLEDVSHSNRTYKAVMDENLVIGNEIYKNRIDGFTDELSSVEQTIYMILGTERYKFPIYSWDYGVELVDLYGKPMPYVMSEIPRRIKDALMIDDRISDVVDFEFERNGKILSVTFTVVTIHGSLSSNLEVEI